MITFFVLLEHCIVDAVVGMHLEIDIACLASAEHPDMKEIAPT